MRTGIAMQELQSRHNKQYILEDMRQKHKQIRKMTSEVGCAMGRENNAKKKVLLVSWNATSEQYLRTISIDRYFVNPVH